MKKTLQRTTSLTLAFLLLAGGLAGCATGSKSKYVYQNPPDKSAYERPAQIQTIRVGYQALPDALPLWAAQKAEYWPKAGVYVELVPYESDSVANKALAEGKVDGLLTDLVQAEALKAKGVDLQVLATTLGVTPQEGAIKIVASSGSKLTKPEELKGKPIAVSRGTAEEYAAEQMLLAAGLKPEEIKFVDGATHFDRAKALLTNAIPVAVLPEKFAFQMTGRGAKEILSDTTAKETLSQTVLAFRASAVQAKADAIKRFLRAYYWGVADTRLNKELAAKLLEQNAKLAEAEAKLYPVPVFPGPATPSKASVEAIGKWLVAKGMAQSAPSFESLVNGSLLPDLK
jgi:ABC-type nitrate/sulfonate/bicarbonate transport system substrate-binding protein